MRLTISDIPEEGLQYEFEFPVTVNEGAGPDTARVNVTVRRFGKKVLIDGAVKISASLKCSRCLKDLSYPLDIRFRDEYNPSEESAGEGEHELTHSELDQDYYNNDEIDVAALVKEQVLLALPMKPLCESECPGICPKCGKDLSKGPCSCKAEEIDPRLAPLARLKETMNDRKE